MVVEAQAIRHIAGQLLARAAVAGPPTPTDDLVTCAGLSVVYDVPLDEQHAEHFAEVLNVAQLRAALRKAMGMLDRRTGQIYRNAAMIAEKRNFVTLHEVGHQALPWQRELALHYDNDASLAPHVVTLFEREANLFAAETLFQLDRFAEDARSRPLGLMQALELARTYRASVHASLRRYADTSDRPCCMLVLEGRPRLGEGAAYRVVGLNESAAFRQRFPTWPRPSALPVDAPIFAHWRPTNLIDTHYAEYTIIEGGQAHDTVAHLFRNGFHLFVLLFPEDLRHRARRRHTRVRR